MGLIPETILGHRPKGIGACEVRALRGRYYVYRYSSVWDAEKKRPKKKTGRCVGRITESEGFVPNAAFFECPPQSATSVRRDTIYDVLYAVCEELFADMRRRVPDLWQSAAAFGLIATVAGLSPISVEIESGSGNLHRLFPEADLSPCSAEQIRSDPALRRWLTGACPDGETLDVFELIKTRIICCLREKLDALPFSPVRDPRDALILLSSVATVEIGGTTERFSPHPAAIPLASLLLSGGADPGNPFTE